MGWKGLWNDDKGVVMWLTRLEFAPEQEMFGAKTEPSNIQLAVWSSAGEQKNLIIRLRSWFHRAKCEIIRTISERVSSHTTGSTRRQKEAY